jgi:hypothetical protein
MGRLFGKRPYKSQRRRFKVNIKIDILRESTDLLNWIAIDIVINGKR